MKTNPPGLWLSAAILMCAAAISSAAVAQSDPDAAVQPAVEAAEPALPQVAADIASEAEPAEQAVEAATPAADGADPAEEAAAAEPAAIGAGSVETAAAQPIGQGAGSRHVMPPLPGKAQIIFFRKAAFVGAAIGGRVWEDDAAIGNLTAGTYFLVTLDPGVHTFSVSTEVKEELIMEVEEGETYFVEETVSMGVLVGRLNLSPSDVSVFDAAFPKMKQAKRLKPERTKR